MAPSGSTDGFLLLEALRSDGDCRPRLPTEAGSVERVIQLIESSFAAERLHAAVAFITGLAPATEILIVGASRDAADDLARRVTVAKGVTFGLHRASLTQLAARFAAADMARHGVAAATTLGTEAIAARAT